MRNRHAAIEADLEYAERMIDNARQASAPAAQPVAAPVQIQKLSAVSTGQATTPSVISRAPTIVSKPDRTTSGVVALAPTAETNFEEDQEFAQQATNVSPVMPRSLRYGRTAKGVVAMTAEGKRFPYTLKAVFFAVDSKATVGELLETTKMNPAVVYSALTALENNGYIAVNEAAAGHDGVEQRADDTDLDFTMERPHAREATSARRRMMNAVSDLAAHNDTPAETAHAPVERKLTGAEQPVLRALGNDGVKKYIATARADADVERRAHDEEMQLLNDAINVLREMQIAAAEEQQQRAEADAEALAQREDLQARVDEMQIILDDAERARAEHVERLEAMQQEIAGERRARADLEATLTAERHAHEVTSKALSELEALIVAERAQHEEQARTFAETNARCSALQSELTEAQTGRKSAMEAAYRHVERFAKIEQELLAERRAHQEAEGRARKEHDRREAAALALLEIKQAVGLWNKA